jgi:S1-C subfamily serine protease
MASGIVVHIAAGLDKHAEVLTRDRIRIGTDENCELWLRSAPLLDSSRPAGLILELARSNRSYRVADFDQTQEITYNGEPLVVGTKIVDGDEVRFERCDILLQFFPVRDLPVLTGDQRLEAHVAPFIEQAALESAATIRRDDAKVFLREFTRELVREINTSTKLITLAMAIALVGGILYIGLALYKEIKQSRHLNEDQKVQLSLLKEQVNKTNDKLGNVDKSNREIIGSLSLAPKLRSDYGGGVCLISGSFIFVEARTGKPLRYPETQTNEEGVVIQNGNDPTALTPDGKGVIAEYEVVGTGFYVGDGYVLTNRHVAQPWLADERAQGLNSSVAGQPRLKKLMAFFPGHAQPLPLKVKQIAKHDDLAVCLFDGGDLPADIPVLPLDKDADTVTVGQAVVMMGYPSGPDRLLALLDDTEARSIQARYGSSLESLLGYLAERNHIQPLTTQGHITDLDVRRIVYDARTAEGGSGAPLFGQSGRVVGINFAVFTENTASNFAVPVRYGSSLLQLAGWTSPEPAEPNQNENANANQNGARNNVATSNLAH